MRKRSLLLLGLLLVLGIGVTGVAAQDPTPSPTPLPPVVFGAAAPEYTGDSDNFAGVDPSGQTVVYWHQYNNPTQLSIITGLVNAFNETNPYGITVNAIASGSYNDIRTLMNNSIVSGELPNLVAGFPNDGLSFALDDAALDLAPYVADAKWGFSADALADLTQVALDSWLFDGVRLGIPNQISGQVMFSNSVMMQELGFSADSPVTLDEFAEAACAAANSDLTGAEGAEVQGYPIVPESSQFETLVAGIGGNIWGDGQWDFTSEPVMRVMQLYKDLYDQGCGYIPAENFGNTADWARALNPFALSSTAGIAPVLGQVAQAGNLVTDWRVLAAPVNAAGDKHTIQLFTPGIVVVPATPEQQLASWVFLRFFALPEVQAQWAQSLSLFPLSKSAAGMMDTSSMVPQFAEMVAKLANDEVNVYVSQQNLSYGTVRGIVGQGLADITSGGMDVAEVAQRMTDESNAALAEG
jgi:multiple sugar transport system substrate-binding protein/sn-glycerol 3-phosphate transport system substrate-binding protein